MADSNACHRAYLSGCPLLHMPRSPPAGGGSPHNAPVIIIPHGLSLMSTLQPPTSCGGRWSCGPDIHPRSGFRSVRRRRLLHNTGCGSTCSRCDRLAAPVIFRSAPLRCTPRKEECPPRAATGHLPTAASSRTWRRIRRIAAGRAHRDRSDPSSLAFLSRNPAGRVKRSFARPSLGIASGPDPAAARDWFSDSDIVSLLTPAAADHSSGGS